MTCGLRGSSGRCRRSRGGGRGAVSLLCRLAGCGRGGLLFLSPVPGCFVWRGPPLVCTRHDRVASGTRSGADGGNPGRLGTWSSRRMSEESAAATVGGAPGAFSRDGDITRISFEQTAASSPSFGRNRGELRNRQGKPGMVRTWPSSPRCSSSARRSGRGTTTAQERYVVHLHDGSRARPWTPAAHSDRGPAGAGRAARRSSWRIGCCARWPWRNRASAGANPRLRWPSLRGSSRHRPSGPSCSNSSRAVRRACRRPRRRDCRAGRLMMAVIGASPAPGFLSLAEAGRPLQDADRAVLTIGAGRHRAEDALREDPPLMWRRTSNRTSCATSSPTTTARRRRSSRRPTTWLQHQPPFNVIVIVWVNPKTVC